MQVKNLIKKLQAFPPEVQVVISGYEGGLKIVTEIAGIEISLNVNPEWHYGRHDFVTDGNKGIKAIYLH
jgi:hypothetical protein